MLYLGLREALEMRSQFRLLVARHLSICKPNNVFVNTFCLRDSKNHPQFLRIQPIHLFCMYISTQYLQLHDSILIMTYYSSITTRRDEKIDFWRPYVQLLHELKTKAYKSLTLLPRFHSTHYLSYHTCQFLYFLCHHLYFILCANYVHPSKSKTLVLINENIVYRSPNYIAHWFIVRIQFFLPGKNERKYCFNQYQFMRKNDKNNLTKL